MELQIVPGPPWIRQRGKQTTTYSPPPSLAQQGRKAKVMRPGSYYDENTDNLKMGKLIFYLFGVLVLITILAGALTLAINGTVLGIETGFSGIKGRAEQIQRNNSVNNRTAKQEYFEQTYQDIKAFDIQINNAAKTLSDFRATNAGKTDNAIGSIANEDSRLSQVLTGLKNQCAQTVADYNAEATKITSRDWRSEDLPQVIPTNNPAVDCKEDSSR